MRNKLVAALCAALIVMSCSRVEHVDVLVVGGGASGISAGVQSARMGVSTMVVEETPWIGGMLTAVVENGANEIDSVSYFSSQYDQAYNQALAKAIELSKGKGEALAAASGMKLGKVLKIQEQSNNQYGRYVSANVAAPKNLAMATMESSIAMDVMPGEMQVTAEIAVEFELLPVE